MTANIELGTDSTGSPVGIDLEELLATRLLVQGNSGSGKSHLLRKLLEGSAGLVQQVVIDPEGDFVSLAEVFDHICIDAAEYSLGEIERLAARAREHRASVVLNLENLEVEGQMRCAAAFLNALFDAPREHWYPVLAIIDEAQLFAPSAAGEVGEEARRVSLAAMTNLMCRGRKRGLAGVIATQRLAKLAKNVAAEASNFLMGRTFLDIDMARAADLLGMERRQADAIRDLSRGEFLALGPALSRRPMSVRVGSVKTAARSGSPKLMPLPALGGEDARERLFSPGPEELALPLSPPPAPAADELMRGMAAPVTAAVPEIAELPEEEQEAVRVEILQAMAEEPSSEPFMRRYQDFTLRCRMRGITAVLPMDAFRRRLAMAQAGLSEAEDWDEALGLAAALPEEMWSPFLAIVGAARRNEPCPDDDRLAALYGTSSPGRSRRMLAYIEEKGLTVTRVDLMGRRLISLPHLGWTTAPGVASGATSPSPRRSATRRSPAAPGLRTAR